MTPNQKNVPELEEMPGGMGGRLGEREKDNCSSMAKELVEQQIVWVHF